MTVSWRLRTRLTIVESLYWDKVFMFCSFFVCFCSPSQVSMAVHRVGKTLLIDELNVPLFFGEMVKVNSIPVGRMSSWYQQYTSRKDKLMVPTVYQ